MITAAGTHQQVGALVYVAGFVADASESVNTLLSDFPADGPQLPILPPRDGYLFLDKDRFHESFAADVSGDEAAFMADAQVPWGLDALGGLVTEPAWRSKDSWYVVTKDDGMIPPVPQRTMAERCGAKVTEVPGSHAIYVSIPKLLPRSSRTPLRRSNVMGSSRVAAKPAHQPAKTTALTWCRVWRLDVKPGVWQEGHQDRAAARPTPSSSCPWTRLTRRLRRKVQCSCPTTTKATPAGHKAGPAILARL